MHELGNILIITEKEYEKYKQRARAVYNQRESHTLNMKLRFPYFIPTLEDIKKHKDISISDIFPYYVYLTVTDEDDNYVFEPDNMELNASRSLMYSIFKPRIFVVNSNEEERIMVEKLGKKEKNLPENSTSNGE